MAVQVIVFDFDGTLVDSNRLKYEAFFELFPRDEFHNRIIKDVLKVFLEESRYLILKEIMRKIDGKKSQDEEFERRLEELANRYNTLVLSGAKICEEKPGAREVLEFLSVRYRLYISSTTPESALKEIVKYRNWDGIFYDIFGYPRDKSSTLLEIIRRESISPDEILVVGDGESDRISASNAGCVFFHINSERCLRKLMRFLEPVSIN